MKVLLMFFCLILLAASYSVSAVSHTETEVLLVGPTVSPAPHVVEEKTSLARILQASPQPLQPVQPVQPVQPAPLCISGAVRYIEPPREGVLITLLTQEDGDTVTFTHTDSNANYIFCNLQEGSYIVVETNRVGYEDRSDSDNTIF